MMQSGGSSKVSVLAISIITLGVAWLLMAQQIGPSINWIWTLGLALVGFLTFVLSGGIDKVSIVLGPIFLVASLLSIARQTGKLSLDVEVPWLVICIGVMLLVSQQRFVAAPRWFVPPDAPRDKGTKGS